MSGLREGTPAPLAVAAGFLTGSLPLTNLAARRLRGVDLRSTGSGTVSGTALYRLAGFGPLAAVGTLEVAKGTVGPALAGGGRPATAALAAAAAVVGHNWSPLLRGAGGRGLSPGIGALLVVAPEGAALVLSGMTLGRLMGETALGTFIALVALGPVLTVTRGGRGLADAAAVAAPIVAKRILGNGRPEGGWGRTTLTSRLMFDSDHRG